MLGKVFKRLKDSGVSALHIHCASGISAISDYRRSKRIGFPALAEGYGVDMTYKKHFFAGLTAVDAGRYRNAVFHIFVL